MTLEEFRAAFALANDRTVDLSAVDDSKLYGCGLPGFRPVHTTREAVAKLIRWQALQFNGQWDAAALDEVAQIGRRNFLLLN